MTEKQMSEDEHKRDDLIERLRSMSRYEHDDLSIGDEAADAIERLRSENKIMRVYFACPKYPS